MGDKVVRPTIASLSARVAELEQQLGERDRQWRGLKSENEEMQTRLGELRGTIAEQVAIIERQRGYLERVREQETPPERRQGERRSMPEPTANFQVYRDMGRFSDRKPINWWE